jgi:transposase
MERKGYKVAIVALARKLPCILHHLLMNQEMCEDEVTKKEIRTKLDAQETSMSIEEMIEYMIKAGYEVKKKSGVGG